jgi:hypothetical protein
VTVGLPLTVESRALPAVLMAGSMMMKSIALRVVSGGFVTWLATSAVVMFAVCDGTASGGTFGLSFS